MWCATICRILWLIFSIFLTNSLILFSIDSRPPYQFEDGKRDEWTSENTLHHHSMWWLFVAIRASIVVDFARYLLTIRFALTMSSCSLTNDEEDRVLLVCDYDWSLASHTHRSDRTQEKNSLVFASIIAHCTSHTCVKMGRESTIDFSVYLLWLRVFK